MAALLALEWGLLVASPHVQWLATNSCCWLVPPFDTQNLLATSSQNSSMSGDSVLHSTNYIEWVVTHFVLDRTEGMGCFGIRCGELCLRLNLMRRASFNFGWILIKFRASALCRNCQMLGAENLQFFLWCHHLGGKPDVFTVFTATTTMKGKVRRCP